MLRNNRPVVSNRGGGVRPMASNGSIVDAVK